ncbi:MAG: hypothetical protein CML24_03285 [Rhizobiales bacterium]|nr:hypothetical protein [Hyphomicrobiales bacterium]|tara:strand:- start:2658 stop:2858 length:201 start_codon:yes stop_codon:yes gene_type:complete
MQLRSFVAFAEALSGTSGQGVAGPLSENAVSIIAAGHTHHGDRRSGDKFGLCRGIARMHYYSVQTY